MSDFKVITPKRDIARELARRYSTMTHDELDVLESILGNQVWQGRKDSGRG